MSTERQFAMIIGAMKSGTTSLYEMLVQHPQICACTSKEPHYFCKPRSYAYEDLWVFDQDVHSVCLEASTSYTKYPSVQGLPERIKAYGIDPYFIYVVRNPVDRIESQYNFMRLNQGTKVVEVDDAELVAYSKYFAQLQLFRAVFPSQDRFLIIDFDDFRSNPVPAVNRCLAFLNLPSISDVQVRRSNSTATSVGEVLIQRSGPLKNRIGRLIGATARRRLKQTLRQITPTVARRLTEAERRHLMGLLKEDMDNFEASYGFDIGKWGFRAKNGVHR